MNLELKSFKGFFKHPLTVGIATVIITAILTYWLTQKNIPKIVKISPTPNINTLIIYNRFSDITECLKNSVKKTDTTFKYIFFFETRILNSGPYDISELPINLQFSGNLNLLDSPLIKVFSDDESQIREILFDKKKINDNLKINLYLSILKRNEYITIELFINSETRNPRKYIDIPKENIRIIEAQKVFRPIIEELKDNT